MLTLILSLPPHLFQTCSGYLCIPPPGPISYCPPTFNLSTRLIFIFAPTSHPHFNWARSDRPPGGRPRLSDSTALLRFPPMLDGPSSSSREPVTDFPCLVEPPFPSLTCAQVPVIPRGSPVRWYLTTSDFLHPLHTCYPPPSGLDQWLSTLPVLSG